jgi:cytochrome c-type biogenesis protein CcmH
MMHPQRATISHLAHPLTAAGFVLVLTVGALMTPAVYAVAPLSPQVGDEALVQYTPEELQETYRQLQTDIMSPYCQGLTLADCPTSGAVAMRERIHNWLEEGRSSEWIMNTLAGEYGEWIRSAPKFSGFGIVAWLAPGAALILGGIWVGSFMRRNTKPAGESAATPEAEPVPQPQRGPEETARLREIEKRVEAELDAWQT